MDIALGQNASITRTVTDADTAAAVGSGDVPALGTPILLAWLEAATLELMPATEEQTSLGVRIGLDHNRPSAVGTEVTCLAEIVEIDGRNVTCKVKAVHIVDGQEVLVARGVVTRVIVERQRFLDRL